jgi:hypothetical protein
MFSIVSGRVALLHGWVGGWRSAGRYQGRPALDKRVKASEESAAVGQPPGPVADERATPWRV